ncbi:hypothetical protein [Pedobacter deserti]|uniref:hypothetical protein n=1 Tax=Pedobacter deserti TaxID=2817382 RepID=UPI00210AE582|nr:hypothetical protein [Pedobacter sp. SYSU D00382]
MNLKGREDGSYMPVAWEYREVIEAEIAKGTSGKIFFFCKSEGICEDSGKVLRLEEVAGKGLFVALDNEHSIRVDRIITLFGKPGAAYDEYYAYGNSCMECHGGDED